MNEMSTFIITHIIVNSWDNFSQFLHHGKIKLNFQSDNHNRRKGINLFLNSLDP